jgi:eukaryotic-like serine/threonine-protein kinase
MALEAGQRIGDRYTLVSRLGSGGMADVWLSDDEMLQRRVALKFLHERFNQDAQFVERFRREAQAAAGLQHPNVVGVYDRGEAAGRHWIAMEYVEGASLKDLINRGLDVGEAVEITRQILHGARFAHERGIVHRDLKPQNVMVDREGRARVLDFGIARAGVSEITQTGSVLGTAQYLSPEQAQGLEVNATSDIYSTGVILYEALTGQVPFDADTPVAVALKQVSEQPRPPSQLNPKVSRALDAVTLRALAKDPPNRFQTAAEFIRALDAAEADPSGGALGETQAFAPAAAAAGAVGGALAAGALGGDEAQAATADPSQPGEQTPAQRGWMTKRRALILGALVLAAAAVAAFALTRPQEVRVPSVVNEPLAEARATLSNQGFEVGVNQVESCDRPNTVIEQDPPGGQAEEGSEVSLTVSLGQSVRVPATRDLEQSEAVRRVRNAELFPRTVTRPSSDVAAGRVISSKPAGGEQVPCEDTVNLTVSKGPNLVTLPSVIGDQQAVAEADLRELGLIPNVETRDADEPEGEVIGQNPGPGSRLERRAEVTIIVSTGAGSVVMPDVEGQSEDAAISTLQARGLSVDVLTVDTEEQSEDGRVISQAPSAGTRLLVGDTVTIEVGELVEQVEIEPSVEAEPGTEAP